MSAKSDVSQSSPVERNLGKTSKGIVPQDMGISGKVLTGKQFAGGNSSSAPYDIAHEYPWTLSKIKGRTDIPYIELVEQTANESELMNQFSTYANALGAKGGSAYLADTNYEDDLKVYDQLWPNRPTGNIYKLPYFTKTTFELSTEAWRKIDDTGSALASIGGAATDALNLATGNKYSKSETAKKMGQLGAAAGLAGKITDLTLKARYPVLNSEDRPTIFAAHGKRSIVISFPLFNTVGEWDWTKNRDFYYQFANANLFYKKNLITCIPPAYYRVLVPGQYYCHAACVTNFTVENLGNTRLVDNSYIIPDAYQFNITLQEMTMPSINQFRVSNDPSSISKVTTI